MKKIISIVLSITLLLTILVGCKGSNSGDNDKGNYEIAQIIIAGGTIDDKSFNQGAWEGVEKFAKENNLTYKYYQSTEDTVDGFTKAIDLAVKNGGKVVVAPGYVFEPAIFKAQDTYPDVKFVLLDGEPQDGTYTEYRTEKNVSPVFYSEEQAGFLAGYASVKEGYRKLGFLGGMAVPAVIKYGFGYIQGADYAAEELGLKKGDVDIKYMYVGNFDTSPENQTLAASWYQGGTEIIFSCGGPVGFSVMAAAEQFDTKVIGVDSDQSDDSNTVITSAVKNLSNSVYQILELYKDDKFPGGETTLLTAKEDGVGLPIENSKFKKFTKENYDEIYELLKEDKDGISSNIKNDSDVDSQDKIETKIVKVESINQ